MTRYRTIVADPPWPQPKGGSGASRWRRPRDNSALPYERMSVAEIRSLPLQALIETHAHLYLWTTNAHVRSAYIVAEAWGFVPSRLLTWCKTPRGIGLGGTFTTTTEFFLFARRGSLTALRKWDTTWFHWKRPHNNHSAKPEAFLDFVEATSPGPYLEVFARRQRLGWDTWGNEALNHVELSA